MSYRGLIPPDTRVAGLDVGGMTEDEARALVEQAFTSPVILNYADEVIKLHPNRVEFRLNESTVWAELARRRAETSLLEGFGLYLLGENPPPIDVRSRARYNEQKIVQFLNDVALEHDRGMLPPQADLETLTFSRRPAGALARRRRPRPARRGGAQLGLRAHGGRWSLERARPPPQPDISLLEEMILARGRF